MTLPSPLRSTRLAALLLAGVVVAACGRTEPTAPQAEPAPATAPLESPAATPAPATEAAPPAPAPQAAAPQAAAPATDGESTTGDAPSGLSPIAAAVAANAPAAGGGRVPARWSEGRNYTMLVPAQPTSTGPDRVEVVEMFWYGCGHCFNLDPALDAWKQQGKPAHAEFVRVPVMWNDVTRAHARLFYTAEALGRLEPLHTAIFREIHLNGRPLADRDARQTEQLHRAFLKQNGVSDADFDKTYRSFAVEGRLQRAEQLTRRYRVTSVPVLVVNGRYVTDISMAGGQTQLLALLTDLANAERRP